MSRCCGSEGTSLRSLRSLGGIVRWLYWVLAWWKAAELPILGVVVGPFGELLGIERKREREEREAKGGKEREGGSRSLCSYSYSTPGLLQLCFFLFSTNFSIIFLFIQYDHQY